MFSGVNMDTWSNVVYSFAGQAWEVIQFFAHDANIGCTKGDKELLVD